MIMNSFLDCARGVLSDSGRASCQRQGRRYDRVMYYGGADQGFDALVNPYLRDGLQLWACSRWQDSPHKQC